MRKEVGRDKGLGRLMEGGPCCNQLLLLIAIPAYFICHDFHYIDEEIQYSIDLKYFMTLSLESPPCLSLKIFSLVPFVFGHMNITISQKSLSYSLFFLNPKCASFAYRNNVQIFCSIGFWTISTFFFPHRHTLQEFWIQ